MNTAERDKTLKEIADFIKEPGGLVSRLDERTILMCKDIEELKEHQAEQNGFIQDTINHTTANTTWIKAFRWIIGGVGTALAIILSRLYGLW